MPQNYDVADITGPSLDPLFWRPARLGVTSAWYGHVPFAHWIISAGRPGCFVELGAHAGVSYAAFCDAVQRERMDTRCFAIDTWKGDEHAGFYDNSIFEDLSAFHERRYASFSRLMRCTFDEALPYFADGSIDLLHIDGRHRYEDVAHDFATWEPKLSNRAVVLFHDTNVRERGFGVWRLWADLRRKYPHFEFLHSHGLGVLAHGPDAPEPVLALCQHEDRERVRTRFALLGERWEQDYLRQSNDKDLRLLKDERYVVEIANKDLQARVTAENRRYKIRSELLEFEKETLVTQIARLQFEKDSLRNNHRVLQDERALIQGSTAWQVLQLLIKLAEWIPRPVRRTVHKVGLGTSRLGSRLLQSSDRSAGLPSPAFLKHAAYGARAVPATPRRRPTQRIIFISGEPDTPGHDYRVLRAMHAAAILGWHAEVVRIETATEACVEGADIVVIWRAAWTVELGRIFERCRKFGTVTIFDLDDLMFRPELANNKVIDGIRSLNLEETDVQQFYAKINQSVRAADLCSCTTTELASHLRLCSKSSFVLPNCWDEDTWKRSRLAVRLRAQAKPEGLVRIGYAGGTRTHQRDFAVAVSGIARVLRERPDCRLVLFRDPVSQEGILVADEFEELSDLHSQIEWRDQVALSDLPAELVRFDINLAPLEVGNAFCEAKSELKYWEAALVDVPTLASPTGPYQRAIHHGQTGYLASNEQEWYETLLTLTDDPALRLRVAKAAYLDVLWRFGPLYQQAALGSILDQVGGGRHAAQAMLLTLLQSEIRRSTPNRPNCRIMFEHDLLKQADVTVIVPVYNYAHYVREALDSVYAQSAEVLDLVVVDDCSTDSSLSTVLEWVNERGDRFNRVKVVQHVSNAGLGFARNTGFDLAETLFVLPLDADNKLRPEAALRLAACLRDSGAAFAYPIIQRFGTDNLLTGNEPFRAARLVGGNFIDAMALIRRDAWAAAGGYDEVQFGWEDYDFWCRLIELGLWGAYVPEVLADYRAHKLSMLHTSTDISENKSALLSDMKQRHPWLDTTVTTL